MIPIPTRLLPQPRRSSGGGVFAAVLDTAPYPAPLLARADWSAIPPRQVRLAELTTTKAELRLDVPLTEDSTFYGYLFCDVIDFDGVLYLEDGLHRAVQAALAQPSTLHVRIARISPTARCCPDGRPRSRRAPHCELPRRRRAASRASEPHNPGATDRPAWGRGCWVPASSQRRRRMLLG